MLFFTKENVQRFFQVFNKKLTVLLYISIDSKNKILNVSFTRATKE